MIGLTDIDLLATSLRLLQECGDWSGLLKADPCETQSIRQHTRTGRSLCADSFPNYIEALTGRMLQVRKAGDKAETIAARSYS